MKVASASATRVAELPAQMVPVASLLWAAARSGDEPTKYRVLVIDDESAVRALLSLFLGEKGLEVATAQSHREGKVLLEQGQFDLVILDWQLDGIQGSDLLHLSKTCHPDISVIIYTGAGTDEDLFKHDLGGEADAIVRKMGPLEALARVVFDHLGQPWNKRLNAT